MKGMTVYDYLGGLRARGVSAFSTEKFRADLSLTKAATSLALWRLRRKLWIATPVNGYHLIVPPEYRALGCLRLSILLMG
jgi:hypothetical protein